MRCSWCPVLCVMHCPTERDGTLLLVSWLGKCGCAASAPLHRAWLWLLMGSVKRPEMVSREMGDTVVEFVY